MSAVEKEAKYLRELNLVLEVLRNLADKNGFVAGSPVQLSYNALVESGVQISLSRVRDLVGKLGALGWREEAWSEPGNVRGSKIIMQPRKISDLRPLPAKVERERFEKEVSKWFIEYRAKIPGSWTIVNPHASDQEIVIAIVDRNVIKPRGRSIHWIFTLDKVSSLPQWLTELLSPKGKLADSTLYTLWKAGRARPQESESDHSN